MSELYSYWEEVRKELNKTEIEQRLLEGDCGPTAYQFTIPDAIDTIVLGDWGADPDAAESDRNLYQLPVLRKAA